MAKEPTPPPISTDKPAPPPAPPPKKVGERWSVNAVDETLISAVSEDGVHFNAARVMLIDGMEVRASLIAAAPEMLAALKNLENDHPDDPWLRSMPRTAWDMVQSSIAKAEGRE